MRVIVTGRLRQRSYKTKQGEHRTVIELDAEEIGPSLRWATTTINKAARRTEPGTGDGAGDPWASPARAAEPSSANAGYSDEPPF